MKQILLSTLLLSAIFNGAVNAQDRLKSSYFNIHDSVQITGKVIGYKPGTGNDFISFLTYDITGNNPKKAFQLQRDGSFSVSLYQPFAGDITLNYKNAFVSIYGEPGGSLIIQVQDNKISAATHNKGAFFAKGKMADVNNLLFDFEVEFRSHDFNSKADIGDKTQTDSLFAIKRLAKLSEELAFLNTFIKDKNISNPVFEQWQKNQLIYAAAKEVILYPFFGKLNKTISEKQLLSFISQIPVNNYEGLHNSAYYNFLDMLVGDEMIIINVNQDYEAIRKLAGYNPMWLYMNKLDSLSNDLTKQVMFYDLYLNTQKFEETEQILSRFNSVINDEYIKLLFNEKNNAAAATFISYNIVNRLKNAAVSDKLKQRLLGIFSKEKGENLFIDFWGDWCGPCMREMPHYARFITALDTKPIKFLFFSAHTTEKSAAIIKNKNHIKADFINLTANEVAIMNNVFEFHSYPSHFIINKAGNVVSNSASIDPTMGVNQLNKLLFKADQTTSR